MNNINNELAKQIELIVNDLEMVLYDIVTLKEYDRQILRVIVMPQDKNAGIEVDKCAHISRLISPLLDVEEDSIDDMFGYDDYTLEVSSPGIERKLKLPKHFKASIDEMLKVKDFNGDIIKGKLIDADDSEITVQTNHGDEIVSYDEISSAKTYYQWHKGSKKSN